MDLRYDPADPDSIDSFAGGLIKKTLREVSDVKDSDISRGKGDLGTLVERFYFYHTPPNDHEPDFPEAGLELKTTGLKRLKNGKLVPKERLVLGMISYHDVVKENFEESYILKKTRFMLVLFYLYTKGLPVIDMRFLAKHLWPLSPEDLKLIRDDWLTIVKKIEAGKAHELSEGDTLYLGACTKAATASDRTSQPNSIEPAKPRAFALKASYIKTLLELDTVKKHMYDNFLKAVPTRSLEDEVIEKLRPFIGNTAESLFNSLGKDINQASKHRYALLAYRMLGVKSKGLVEFQKAGIIVKTVRLSQKGTPKEDVSFPHFDYMEIIEDTWEDSDFKDITESKFFFIVFQEDEDENLIFKGGQFWNMPADDRAEAERVWHETVRRIKAKQADFLPNKKFSAVAHVRPHGRKGSDTLPAPGGLNEVKKCFWLNASYVASQLH